uniref:NADH-ubiquinone oxidoreductase chain 4 n=1 Tax=Thyreophagus entomophagus TaxID=2874286 RepID=A0A977KCL4_9ACAR|nr:NADH dehydrogenase subunit 4 [Thyreophagus entomophagus]UXD78889.1 NADH dehydrogenase subunit 4 [Thyreophagus entomophagus]
MMVSLLFFFSIFSFFDGIFFFFMVPFLFFFYFYSYGGTFDGVFYVDYFSFLLVFVSIWVFVYSYYSMNLNFVSMSILFVMLFFLLFSFLSFNYLIFYLSFEFVFLLMFFFLLGWGKTAERLQASFYMFFYTMFFSLPFLVMLIDFYFSVSSCFFSFNFFSYSEFFWFFFLLVFVVKLPLFGFHLWLPKAHVEAPVAGSMILAGVLLKLGGYGIFRFMSLSPFLSFSYSFIYSYLFYLSLVGGVLVCFLCFRQMDLKMMVAYSSVVHMSIMLLGFLSYSSWGTYGALLMMVAHGFVSPSMFFLLTYLYDLKHSRSFMLLGAMLLTCPVFCMLWFFSCSLNLGFPPFMSFFSEILIISSLGGFSLFDFVLLILFCFFTGIYCVYMYTSVSHGNSVFTFLGVLNFKFLFISFFHFFFIFSFPLIFFLIF